MEPSKKIEQFWTFVSERTKENSSCRECIEEYAALALGFRAKRELSEELDNFGECIVERLDQIQETCEKTKGITPRLFSEIIARASATATELFQNHDIEFVKALAKAAEIDIEEGATCCTG